MHKRVLDRNPSLRESSWEVCGFRTEFFEERDFLEAASYLSSEFLKSTQSFLRLNLICTCFVYTRWQTVTRSDSDPPSPVSAAHASWIRSQTLTAIPPSSLRYCFYYRFQRKFVVIAPGTLSLLLSCFTYSKRCCLSWSSSWLWQVHMYD